MAQDFATSFCNQFLHPLALAEALPNMIEGGVFAVERGDDPMAQQQAKPALDTVDPVWARIRREAEETVRREPELATFIYSTILHHDTLEPPWSIGWPSGSTIPRCLAN